MNLLSTRMGLLSFALVGAFSMGVDAPAQAATVSDTFELKATFKEWCKGNTRLSDAFTVKVKDGFTLTVTRDDSGSTDLQATIDTLGVSPDIDAIPLSGKAYFSNKAQNKLEFVLSGVQPTNPDHFLTLRGQAAVDKYGHLTKVSGTVSWQETTTYVVDKKTGQLSNPVECFSSGTFGTGKNLTWVPPSTGGGGGGGNGTLTVTGAPPSVGGKFVTDSRFTGISHGQSGAYGMAWGEWSGNTTHLEALALGGATGSDILIITFVATDNFVSTGWSCVTGSFGTCSGVTVNTSTGTVTFSNTVLGWDNGQNASSITLNGTLHFAPF